MFIPTMTNRKKQNVHGFVMFLSDCSMSNSNDFGDFSAMGHSRKQNMLCLGGTARRSVSGVVVHRIHHELLN